MKRYFWFFFFLLNALIIILFDGWMKYQALQYFKEQETYFSFHLIRLVLYKNYGVAFDIPLPYSLVFLITSVLISYLLFLAYKQFKKKPWLSSAYLLIIFGALGNLYDRFVYGFTIDYLLLFEWSVINLSDVCILSGIILAIKQRNIPKKN